MPCGLHLFPNRNHNPNRNPQESDYDEEYVRETVACDIMVTRLMHPRRFEAKLH